MLDLNAQELLKVLSSLKVDACCGEHKDFFQWNNETEELKNCLFKIGQVSVQPSETPFESQYWGEDAPIRLDKYPYYLCNIFQCKKCRALFFYYLELGGHGAQKRYRLVRKELIMG
jgi:hypothetical protein